MTPTARTRLEIFVDGSSRGNPGRAGCGVVIRDQEGTILLEEGFHLGEMTNNGAEYNGLVIALEEALLLKADSVTVYSDSELLVRQMNGQYRVKHPQLRILYQRAVRLSQGFASCRIEYVPRERNEAADRLARGAANDPTRRRALPPATSSTCPGQTLF